MRVTRPTGETGRRALVAALLLVGLYGAGLVLAGDAARALFSALGFGFPLQDAPPGRVRDHVELLHGVLGSVILGWMTSMVMVARGVDRTPDGWWRVVVTSLTVWFVADTGWSLWVGSVEHAAFNVAFVALVAGPLTLARPVRE